MIAKVDRRSTAEVLAWCAERGLPLVEEELQERSRELAKLIEKPQRRTANGNAK